MMNYKHGEQIPGCQELKEGGKGVGGSCYGYNTATWGIFVVMEMFCILTVSISISSWDILL